MALGGPIYIPGTAFIPDTEAQLVGGDGFPSFEWFEGRLLPAFDDTAEEAVVSPEILMPAEYGAGTLTAYVFYFMKSDNSNDIAVDVFVEAKTLDSDTLDMETAASWDSANSGTESLSGSTAGDPLVLSITLTNKDSIAASDIFRIGFRRDCDSANDDASGDLVLIGIALIES